jgi:hypothetical protein
MPVIESATMDGNDRRILVNTKLSVPVALAMHEPSDFLYFADSELGLIERVHVLTGKRELVTSQHVHQLSALAVFNNRVYWTDLTTNELVSDVIRQSTDDTASHLIKLDAFPSPPSVHTLLGIFFYSLFLT